VNNVPVLVYPIQVQLNTNAPLIIGNASVTNKTIGRERMLLKFEIYFDALLQNGNCFGSTKNVLTKFFVAIEKAV
jgi:hypothetical protein